MKILDKMKVVKTLPKFAIIYLHNPFKCIDCKDSGMYLDEHIFSDSKTAPVKVGKRKVVPKNSMTLRFTRKPCVVHQTRLTLRRKQCVKHVYKQKSKLRNKRTKPIPIKKEKLKERKIKKMTCIKSVIKAERSKGRKQFKKKRVKKSKNAVVQNQCCKPKIEKSNEQKPPGKGTLKRKRWFFEKLNSSNENYEDDIFENEKFYHFQGLIEDEIDSIEKYENIKTPQLPFSISPKEESPSPVYKDCYSPTELTEYRKGAEEYRFRRGKMKKSPTVPKIDKNPVCENKPDVQKTLEAVVDILNKTKKMLDKHESDSDEDPYFTDLFDPKSSQ